MTSTHQKYWAKTDRSAPLRLYHLLAFHNLDVAAVAYTLMELDPSMTCRLAAPLGMSAQGLRHLVALFMAVHDVGKFDATFQNLQPALRARLQGDKPYHSKYPVRHDALGFFAWRRGMLFTGADIDPLAPFVDGSTEKDYDHFDAMLDVFVEGIFGHHGKPVAHREREEDFLNSSPIQADITAYCEQVCALLLADAPEDGSWRIPKDTPLSTMRRLSWPLAGLYVLCDWLGSDSEVFTYHQAPMPLELYWKEVALPRARRAILEKRLLPCLPSQLEGFEELFKLPSMRPMQACAATQPISTTPQLFILEDETGSGKTEAALLLAHAMMRQGAAHGIYIGLPTMATTNAMFERFGESYQDLFAPHQEPSIILAHSQRKLSAPFQEALRAWQSVKNRSHTPAGDEETTGEAQCADFFAQHRHLALFADVGVGTIDQALVAALTVKHQSLRMFALGRRVLIVDEVHAYAPYTHDVLCQLLRHHAAQGGSAILLSATLPLEKRRGLLEAFAEGGAIAQEVLAAPTLSYEKERDYPLLTRLSHSALEHTAPPIPQAAWEELQQRTAVEFVHHEDEVFAKLHSLPKTQCACWIRNTVGDAIAAYERLSEDASCEVILFHARMTMEDRQRVEQEVLRRFGKRSTQRERAGCIVIATQVVEQSLDVDFDVMISDLAPVDLLLQRMGRYRRHTRGPDGALLSRALKDQDARGERVFTVLAPAWDAQPDVYWFPDLLRGASHVYAHHSIVWRTMRALGGDTPPSKTITIPRESRALIEAVYGAGAKIPGGLKDQHEKLSKGIDVETQHADKNSISLEHGYGEQDSDNDWSPERHIPTRLGEPRVTLRLGLRGAHGALEPLAAAPTGEEPGSERDLLLRWAMSEVSISMNKIDEEVGSAWLEAQKKLMSDRCKYALLVPLKRAQDGGYHGFAQREGVPVPVTYTHERGLEIKRPEQHVSHSPELPSSPPPKESPMPTTRLDDDYNLLAQRWIPVRHASGRERFITPYELGDDFEDDPILSVSSPRPDLDGALTQFLIALYQTALPPGDDSAWRAHLERPPEASALRAAMEPIKHAFNLCGPETSPRFMQELGEQSGSQVPVTDIFVNAPGDNTRKKNADFFIKRTEQGLSYAAAAAGLFAMQTNAYGGGPGYRTSVRGGGPLTTLILGPTLWHTVYANVLNAGDVGLGEGLPEDLSMIFPWLAPTRYSDKSVKKAEQDTLPLPSDAHLMQVYWAMPWRLWLNESPEHPAACGIYGGDSAFETFTKNNYGVNYAGLWEHPLTPYRKGPDKKSKEMQYISMKATARSFLYTSWPDMALLRKLEKTEEQDTSQDPALVLRKLSSNRLGMSAGRKRRQRSTEDVFPWLTHGNRQVWMFGYEMDNAKTLQWREGIKPVFIEPLPSKQLLYEYSSKLIEAARSVSESLYQCVRRMLAGKVTKKSGRKVTWDVPKTASSRDSALMASLLDAFWRETEPDFFATVQSAHDLILAHAHEDAQGGTGEPGATAEIYALHDLSQAWLTLLNKVAERLFEVHAPGDVSHLKDMRTVVLARDNLRSFTHPRGKRMREFLDLPVHETQPPNKEEKSA